MVLYPPKSIQCVYLKIKICNTRFYLKLHRTLILEPFGPPWGQIQLLGPKYCGETERSYLLKTFFSMAVTMFSESWSITRPKSFSGIKVRTVLSSAGSGLFENVQSKS